MPRAVKSAEIDRRTTTKPRQVPFICKDGPDAVVWKVQLTLTGREPMRVVTVPLPFQLPPSEDKNAVSSAAAGVEIMAANAKRQAVFSFMFIAPYQGMRTAKTSIEFLI